MVALASPRVQSKAHPVADVQVVQYRDGTIMALSLSKPGVLYTITLSPLSCTCRGFEYRKVCCHSQAALERFASPCAWCGQLDAQAFINGFDGDSIINLCPDCLTNGTAPAAWWAALRPVEA